MKIINKNIDPIAEAKKHKRFQEFSRDAEVRINLGAEVYNRRKDLGLSQQELAKKIHSTQKVISNIELANVDVQLSTINRLNGVLKFTAESWAKIFGFALPKTAFAGVLEYKKNQCVGCK